MIKIKVYPGLLCSSEALDEYGFVYLEDEATIAEVYDILKYPLPLRKMGLCMVNYEKAHNHTRLKDGDIVSFFTPLAGG